MNAKELNELIDAAIDGDVSEADFLRLEAELAVDATARKTYYARVSLAQALTQEAKIMPMTAMKTPTRWLQWRPLTAAATGIVFGMFSASMVWAGVVLLRHEPEPVAVALANADFETPGLLAIGGFPKRPGQWRGDAAEVVSETSGIRPQSGAGMLQFQHSDGKTDGVGRKFYGSDQWQLMDLTEHRASMGAGDGVVAELEAWFNSTATKSEEREAFFIELFAIRAASVAELNAISSFWLRQSNVVVAAGSRRLVVDTDPATWERVAFDLPVPAEARYLLIHLCADARPGAAVGKLFPGEFADSVSLKLRPVLREAGPVATR